MMLMGTDVHRARRTGDVDGAGAGLVGLQVVTEQRGRALFPGPYLPAVVTSAAPRPTDRSCARGVNRQCG
jgi:hypothetical protein